MHMIHKQGFSKCHISNVIEALAQLEEHSLNSVEGLRLDLWSDTAFFLMLEKYAYKGTVYFVRPCL